MARDTMISWLGGHLSEMFGKKSEAEAAPPPPEVAASGPSLEELTRSIELLRGDVQVSRKGETEDQRQGRLRAEKEEAERLGAEQHRREMLEDILEFHRKLETGIDRAELDRLVGLGHTWMEETRAAMDTGDLAGRTIGAVIGGIYRHVGELAWDDLRKRMADHGVGWPDPAGLPPHCDPADLERARKLQDVRERNDFVETKAVLALDRMLGIVEVWRAAYPDRGSKPWVSTCLRGVAAAVRLRMFERAYHAVQERRADLRRDLTGLLQEKMTEVQALLDKGVTSVAEADRISRETEKIIYQTAPEFVWNAVKDAVVEPVAAS